mmetsp:Transcript_40450/g.86146  ORF Transcript_40450/g.86146 Transcript_40450/m.86146 type:complete len:201 (+) Transcript_40450:1098-1700(+)
MLQYLRRSQRRPGQRIGGVPRVDGELQPGGVVGRAARAGEGVRHRQILCGVLQHTGELLRERGTVEPAAWARGRRPRRRGGGGRGGRRAEGRIRPRHIWDGLPRRQRAGHGAAAAAAAQKQAQDQLDQVRHRGELWGDAGDGVLRHGRRHSACGRQWQQQQRRQQRSDQRHDHPTPLRRREERRRRRRPPLRHRRVCHEA